MVGTDIAELLLDGQDPSLHDRGHRRPSLARSVDSPAVDQDSEVVTADRTVINTAATDRC